MNKPTQKEVEKCWKQIKKNIGEDSSKRQFLCENCMILTEKLSENIKNIDKKIIKQSKEFFVYCPPECIEEYLNRVCFYLALKELGVEKKFWL